MNNRASSLYLRALKRLSFSSIVNMMHKFFTLIVSAIGCFSFVSDETIADSNSKDFETNPVLSKVDFNLKR